MLRQVLRQRYVWQTGCLLLWLSGSSLCCGVPLCDPELKKDTAYLATVSEIYNQQSSALYNTRYDLYPVLSLPTCGAWDGLGPGATVSLSTTKTVAAGSCDLLWGEIQALPNGAQWQRDETAGLGVGFRQYSIFTAIGAVVSGPCRGGYTIALERPDEATSVFTATSPGALPSMVLGRTFSPEVEDSGTGCVACADAFVAQLAVVK